MQFSQKMKWTWTMLLTTAALAVSFLRSSYFVPHIGLENDFQPTTLIQAVGQASAASGFAVGCVFWAPLNEIYGRQLIFLATFVAFIGFTVGIAVSSNMTEVIVTRFFAAAFGSSTLVNPAGVMADIWPEGQNHGWRWIQWFICIFSAITLILVTLIVPEIYGPLLLRRRAKHLSRLTGKNYISSVEKAQPGRVSGDTLTVALKRPWILLYYEPLVLLLSIYLAIFYNTLFLLFPAFPEIYENHYGWHHGKLGLSFLGLIVGIAIGLVYMVGFKVQWNKKNRHEKTEYPETRLAPTMVGSIASCIGMFWFAWANGHSIHWIVSIIGQAPIGFGLLLIFAAIQDYLMDIYTIYSSSALAASLMVRSVFGTAFTLFTPYMYESLGVHWAASIPAFLCVGCLPFSLLFYFVAQRMHSKSPLTAAAETRICEMQSECH